MTPLDRRGFLAAIASTGVAARLVEQDLGQDTTRGAADPLPNPRTVGAVRRVVDSAQNDPVVVGIERRLHCVCGCGLDVFTCRTTDFTCTYSPALHDEVVTALGRGLDPDAVLADFVTRYGESILMAPKARGFGIVGYALPGAVVLTAMAILGGGLWRRSRRIAPAMPIRTMANPAPPVSRKPADADELARLERALEELES